MSVSVLPGRAAKNNACPLVATTPSLAISSSCSSSESIPTAPILVAERSESSSVEQLANRDTEQPPNAGPRVGAKRYYSSSESECLQSTSSSSTQQPNAENAKKESRNNNFHAMPQHRGRAAKRRRFQSPNSNEVHGNGGKVGGGGGKGGKAAKQLARVPLTQQPKAPNNTTQFLITDREERESSDRDTSTDVLGTSADFSKLRPRCYSSACKNDTSMESSYLMQSSDSDEEQEEEDSEFDTIYDNVSLERIQGLPRDKVNREMLTTQKCNSHLVDKVTHLKTENHRLKSLLQQHGIDFNKSTLSDLSSNLFSPQHVLLNQSTSRSSVESEENSTAGNEEEAGTLERSLVTVKQEQR